MLRSAILWGILAVAAFSFQTASGAMIYVDDNAPNDPGSGDPTISDPLENGTADHPFDAIQQGVDAATDGDTVLVADGSYSGQGNHDIELRGKAFTVQSSGGPRRCVIDCKGTELEYRRGFYLYGAYGKKITVGGFSIINSLSDWGGGIRIDGNTTADISNCIFRNNVAQGGGGILIGECNIVLADCLFYANRAWDRGGGCYIQRGNVKVIRCTFLGNSALLAGGLHHFQGQTEVAGCLFSGNTGRDGASAIWMSDCTGTFSNSTISRNMGGWSQGGVYIGYGDYSFKNCILWGNGTGKGREADQLTSAEARITIAYSCVQGLSQYAGGAGNIGVDPKFADEDGTDNKAGTDDDNLRLLPDSPCVDAGSNSRVAADFFDLDGDGNVAEPMPLDLEGALRFVDNPDRPDTGEGTAPSVDMGPYEGGRPAFVLSRRALMVGEGTTETISIALSADPKSTCTVSIAHVLGDPDLHVSSGTAISFHSGNYSIPQIIAIQADEDPDYRNGLATLEISAPGIMSAGTDLIERDNDAPERIYVDSSSAGAGTGKDWANAFKELRDALALAPETSVTTIWVAEGTYKPAGPNSNPEVSFELFPKCGLYGGFPRGGGNWDSRNPVKHRTILSGDLNGNDIAYEDLSDLGANSEDRQDNAYHVVRCKPSAIDVIFDGFVIRSGHARYYSYYSYDGGGGMRCATSSIEIRNCSFEENFGWNGGGLLFRWVEGFGTPTVNGHPLVAGCAFLHNVGNGAGATIDLFHSYLLKNCLFKDNYSPGNGSGLYLMGDTFGDVENCTFEGNQGGGAIAGTDWPGEIRIIGCRLLRNLADGIRGNSGGRFTVILSEVSDNAGTGILVGRDGMADIRGCHIANNSNGGIRGRTTATNCIIERNRTLNDGGGVACDDGGNIVLNNCLLIFNFARNGGAVNQVWGEASIFNCSIVNNRASENVGGVLAFKPQSSNKLYNTILWGNTDSTGSSESSQVSGPSIDIQNDCIEHWSGALQGINTIGSDPIFAYGSGKIAYDLRLLPGSPCLDRGNNSLIRRDYDDFDGDGDSSELFPKDLDGDPRIVGDTVDIGAYEGIKAIIQAVSRDPSISEGGTGSLEVTLITPPPGPVEVRISKESGDPDLSLIGPSVLLFISDNYTIPQSVTFAAAEDDDNFNSSAQFIFQAQGYRTTQVVAVEGDNETVMYVDSRATGRNDGTRWTDAYTDLYVALLAAANMPNIREIHVAQGIHSPPVAPDPFVFFRPLNGVAIQGGYAGNGSPNPDLRDISSFRTILRRDDGVNCVVKCENVDRTAVIDGMVIESSSYGISISKGSPTVLRCMFTNRIGGVCIAMSQQSSPLISECSFLGNDSGLLGTILLSEASTPEITHCRFEHNTGSPIVGKSSTVKVSDCDFLDNHAQYGAGLYNSASRYEVMGCRFEGNNAGNGGGVLYNETNSSGSMENCRLIGNFTGNMGTVCNDGALVVKNCLFSGNAASYYAGAIVHGSSTQDAVIVNCAFVGNTAGSGGGALLNNSTGRMIVSNSILWGNSVPGKILEQAQIDWNRSSGAIQPTIQYCCIEGWSETLGGIGNAGKDPLFVNATAGDFHLRPGSPCIDTGTNTPPESLPPSDLDGQIRIQDGNGDGNPIVDKGIFEAEPVTGPVIDVDQSVFVFEIYQGIGGPETVRVSVNNWGIGSLQWGVESDCPWLTAAIVAGGTEVEILMDPSTLLPGTNSGTVRITSTNAVNSPVLIRFNLSVGHVLRVPHAYPTIRQAVEACIPGDLILLADGIYTGDGNRNIEVRTGGFTIRGENGPERCVMDGEIYGRGFDFSYSTGQPITIEGISIVNASQGIYSYAANKFHRVQNCIFRNCSRSAIDGKGSGIVIEGCRFYDSVTPLIWSSPSSGNATISRCVFQNNKDTALALTGPATITNCLISNTLGTAIQSAAGGTQTLSIDHCTIVNNGRGVLVSNMNATVNNSILWGNLYQAVLATGVSSTLSFNTCVVEGGWAGTGVLDVDPRVAYDGHLMKGSPCIDAAIPGMETGLDIDGEPRISGGAADIGADEFIDAEDDGLPDFWETQYFGNVTAGKPEEDSDADGRINLAEYQAAKNPFSTVYYVDVNRPDDSGDGLSWETAKKNIKAAINLAQESDVILVGNGEYPVSQGWDFYRGMGITVQSQNGPEVCTIQCQDGKGIDFTSGESRQAELIGFTIAGATDPEAILISKSSPTISNCRIQDNADKAIYIQNGGHVTLLDCILTRNNGDALQGDDCHITARRTQIVRNGKAGIYMPIMNYQLASVIRLDSCLIAENGSQFNGHVGISCWSSSAYNGELYILNCSIVDNGNQGIIVKRYSKLVVHNSIIWGHGIPIDLGIASNQDTPKEMSISYSAIQGGFAGTGNIQTWPRFSARSDGNYHLMDGSPCINAGDSQTSSGADPLDLDGNSRVLYGRVDMGCYETIRRDYSGDGSVDLSDLMSWASHWLENGCEEPVWCDGADMTFDGLVGMEDHSVFAEGWLRKESGTWYSRYPFDGNWMEVNGPWTANHYGDPEFVGPSQARIGSGAVELDGDDRISLYLYNGFLGSLARTSMAWIKTTHIDMPLIFWGRDAVAGGTWDMRVNSQGQLRLQVGGGAGINSATKVNTGQWVHVAAVLPDGGTNVDDVLLFVNGVLETNGTMTAGLLNTREGIWVQIGADLTNTYFTGLIDDVQLYDRALTADEIIAAMELPSVFAGIDQIVNSNISNRTTLEGRLFQDWVGASADWQQVSGPEGVVIADPTSLSTTIEFSQVGEYVFRLTATKGVETASDEVVIAVTDGEVGYWKFDGNLLDLLGNHGAAVGDPGFVDVSLAKVGTGAVELDGNDAVVVSGFTGITGTAARSCMAWIKTTTGTAAPIVYWGDKNTAGGTWDMRVNAAGQLRIQSVGGGGANSVSNVNTGQWVHVAAVLPEDGDNADDVQLYVNGVLETGGALAAGAINTKALAPMRIGTDETGKFFTGLIDDVRVYDRALSPEEIAALASQ